MQANAFVRTLGKVLGCLGACGKGGELLAAWTLHAHRRCDLHDAALAEDGYVVLTGRTVHRIKGRMAVPVHVDSEMHGRRLKAG